MAKKIPFSFDIVFITELLIMFLEKEYSNEGSIETFGFIKKA